jgi:Tol biopolymer transport system component
MIAFHSEGDVWTVPRSGSPAVKLTEHEGPDGAPIWSPDGREIAYISIREGQQDVWIVPAQGGESRQLTDNPAQSLPPSWSPDGLQLAVPFCDTARTSLGVIPAAGGPPRLLTNELAFDAWGQRVYWSPDGEWIIFPSIREGRPLWRVPAAGGEAEPFLDGRSPTWSADGERVYFAARRGGQVNLYERRAGATTERQLTDFVGKHGHLESLRDTDGEYLYFIWSEDHGDLWVMDVDASP